MVKQFQNPILGALEDSNLLSSNVQSVRVNMDFPDTPDILEQLPADLEWKESREFPYFTNGWYKTPQGKVFTRRVDHGMCRELQQGRGRSRYHELRQQNADDERSIPRYLWQEKYKQVEISRLWQGLSAAGMIRVKAYVEYFRHGKEPERRQIYRMTWVWMYKNIALVDPEIAPIVPKLEAVTRQSIAQVSELRYQMMWNVVGINNPYYNRATNELTDLRTLDISVDSPIEIGSTDPVTRKIRGPKFIMHTQDRHIVCLPNN